MRADVPQEGTSQAGDGTTGSDEAIVSSDLLRRALDSANDVIIGVDLDQCVILWNKAAEHSYGLTAAEALGRPLTDCYTFEFLSEAEEAAAYASLTEDGRWCGRCVHTTRDGRRLMVDAAVSVMLDDEGAPLGQLAVIRDIAGLRRLEGERADALADVETEQRRLRTILDALPLAIGLSDANGGVLELNAEVDKLWRGRYQPQGIPEYNVYRAWWPDGRELQPEEWTTARVYKTREPVDDDLFEIERFDGTHAMVQSTAVPIFNEADELDGVVGIVQDVTERHTRARLGEALNEIGAILHSSLGSDEVFERALDQMSRTLSAHNCGIALREGAGWRVKWVVGSEASRAGCYYAEDELPAATNAYTAGKVFVSERAHMLPATEGFSPSQSVTAPLIARDETVGVLTVLRVSTMPFMPVEVEFIEQASSAIALALENARLYAQQLETATLSAALARIDTTLHSALDLDSIMERALSYGAAALAADSASVGWREGEGVRVAFVHGMPKSVIGRLFPAEDDHHGAWVARTRQTLAIPDTLHEELVSAKLREEFRLQSVIIAPIMMRGNVEATLYFNYHEAPHVFSDAQESFVRNLASSLSLALDNSLLFQEQRERGRLADSLNRIDAAINRTLDFEVALDVALPEAAEALFADSVVLLQHVDDAWSVARTYGAAEGVAGKAYDESEMPVGRAALERKEVVAVSDVQATQHSPRVAIDVGAKAVMVAPLVHGGRTFGLLYVNDHQANRDWQPHEIDFLSAFSAHLSLAAENARLYRIEHERATLNEALAEIDTLIHGSSVFSEWMGLALEMVGVSIGADSGSVVLRVNGDWVVRYQFGFDDDYLGYRFPDDDADFLPGLTWEMAPIIVEHPVDKPDVVEWAGGRVEFGCNLVAPLVESGEVFGALIFNGLQRGRFRRPHVEFVRKFAASVTLGLENQRLYEGEQRSASLARALNSVNEALLSTLSVDEMLEQIVQRVSEAAGASAAAMLRPDGEDWVVTSVHNLPDSFRGHRLSDAAARTVREQARGRRPMLVGDVPEEVRRVMHEETGLGDARSVMFLPLRANGGLVGVVIFGYAEHVDFGAGETEFAQRTSTAITLALENARLFQSERHIAETLQDTLLVVPHRIPGIDFARIYRPATNAMRVGGDFIDAFELTHRRVGLALGDVSGKGLKAASATAMVRNTLRAHAVEALPPSVVAEKTSNVLSLFTAAETFVTAFFGMLDTRTGCLDYVSAGHPPTYVIGMDGSVSTLEVRSPVLGAFSGVSFRDGRHVLLPGDCLFAYSDGLIEARVDGKLFGEERLATLLPRFAGATPEELVNGIFDAVNEFTSGDFRDDVALLAVSRKAQPGTPPGEEFGMLF